MLVAVAVTLLLPACPLGPGQSRCTTSNVYGTLVTNCEEGEPHPQRVVVQQPTPQPAPQAPVPVEQPQGFWCTVRPDGDGVCDRRPGICEMVRSSANLNALETNESGPCERRAEAICAPSGCFTTPARCAFAERLNKRTAAQCEAVR